MLDKFGEVINDADLTNYNTYGIKTSAKYLVKPDSLDNLKELIYYLECEDIEYFILGGGSNIILPDNAFNGVIITLEKLNNIKVEDNKVYSEAGVLLSKFVNTCIDNSLSGVELLCCIPGTVGGALYGNAGVKDTCIYDNLESITVLRNNEFITLNKEKIKYGYRDTMFKNNYDIIVSATFNLTKGNTLEMQEIVKENRCKRIASQPLEFKNAGSVFKNPAGDYAGRLIESLGLKGYSIGDASISEKHANFIINKGNATSKDIVDLIIYVRKQVMKEYGIKLKLEQIIVEWE